MGEIIRTWLRTRLGVIIDLSPDVFGHYSQDGTLLAKLLHSYDIINESQLRTLIRTQDPALSRVNLKNLRIWLRFIGVDCDDECIEDISNGKGTTALRLIYKLFLALENKDSLHFITLQKEREKFIPNSSKFDVTIVTEEPELRKAEDHPLAGPLKKASSLIEWQRKKSIDFEELSKSGIENLPTEKRKVHSELKFASSKSTTRKPKAVLTEEEKKELDEFARKHRVEDSDAFLEPCVELSRFSIDNTEMCKTDHKAAKAYTKSLKQKYRQEAMTKSFKSRMQKALLSEVWEKVVNDQEMEFDELIARKVLSQSQYEKKMMRMMFDIRNEKSRMATNRQIVEDLSQRTKEHEARLEEERSREVFIRESEEVEAERRRMKELERRINEDVARRKLRKLRKIGEEAVNDLINIATRAAEYKIASIDSKIPNTMWNQWKALFVMGQPISATVDDDIRAGISKDQLEEEEIGQAVDYTDFETEDVLNDNDFENYHEIKSPWAEFVTDVDLESREFLNRGIMVLGYIVHKVLESLYPHAEDPVAPPLPKMRVRATVLGIPDTLLYEPMRVLLKQSRIHLVCLEDAINYCLEQYKTEMKDHEYIDLNIIAASKETLTRQSSASVSERGKKSQLKEKKSAPSGVKAASLTKKLNPARSGLDKITQTPKVIPYEDMDPILSDSAYIGKWTHEFLTLGQPISDDLNARIILEYLKGLKNVQGFVLINYPTNYQQMASLEFALSGKRMPDNREKYLAGGDETNIEEIDPVPSRITFDGEWYDSLDLLRKSRLLPDPLQRLDVSDGNSYFTAFIRIKPKPKELQKSDSYGYEVLPDDRTSLEAFYVDQQIATVFYYAMFDLSTLKKLARILITGESSFNRIPSQELFGEAMHSFEGRTDDVSSISKAPIVRKLLSRVSISSSGESEAFDSSERSRSLENEVVTFRTSSDEPPLPGDADWPWANFSQPPQLLQSLATLWQGIETSYIDNLKDMFQLKRRHFCAIVPYTTFVKKHMEEFIERPDKKQDLLHEFHRAFNDLDGDIRDDMEAKRELHCRIADFETVLWDICNERRKEAEEERRRIIHDHWTTQEAMILTNVFIGILQAELDRYIDTLQFIQDYCLAMLQRPLQEVRQSKVVLQKIPVEIRISGSKQEINSMTKLSSKSLKEKESKETKVKTSSVKTSVPPTFLDENRLKEEIAKLLTDVQQENFDATQTICYKSIENNVQYVRSIVDSMASLVLDVLKKEEIAASKTVESKDKKGSSKKGLLPAKAEPGSARRKAEDFVLEWKYALMFEINRIRLRLKMLNGAAKSDIHYLIDFMQRLFFGIHKLLVDRYKSEIKSVNLMASTFRYAVEEARPIQKEMLLDGDRFLVRSNVLMYPDKPEPDSPPGREEISPTNFQMAQLGRLLDIFRRVAPCGSLTERSFVYILQDLIACGDEEGGISPLPYSWMQLRACDVPKLVNDIFGDVQFVDWREFIIYAMNIEIPSMDQLLDALEAFRSIDKNFTDTITCEEFHSVGLWFLYWDNIDEFHSTFLLHENFEIDEEHEEKVTSYDSTISKRDISSKNCYDVLDMKPESIMRLTLAKELLCEMFLCESQRVNYMALLLAFCKDEEPKKGLGKAFSLAIGKKICVDWEEGEKYVNKIIEEKRRIAEVGEKLRKEAHMTSKAILNVVLKGVLRKTKSVTRNSDKELPVAKRNSEEKERIPIRIENLDSPGELVDPADLLPPENEIPNLLEIEDDEADEGDGVATFEQTEVRLPRVSIILPETFERRRSSQTVRYEIVHWLNLEVYQAVLTAMLPRLATQPDLFESGKSLRENLKSICSELRDGELNEDADQILSHRFLEHTFVKKVIASTSQFTTRSLENIVAEILHENR